MAVGTACRRDGTVGTLQAPLAITTERQTISPALVDTRYPPAVGVTEVTAVWVRTGARATAANREMKSITSLIVM
jgi:hypothetical protein